MSNTRRAAIRVSVARLSSAFAATAFRAVAGAGSASAAVDPGNLPLGNVADVTSVTSTVTSTAGKLPPWVRRSAPPPRSRSSARTRRWSAT